MRNFDPEKAVYRAKYCRAAVEHFASLITDEAGQVIGIPSFAGFAEHLGVTVDALSRWRRENPAFDAACRQGEALLAAALTDAALCEKVNVSAARLVLSSLYEKENGRNAGGAGRGPFGAGFGREPGAGAAAQEVPIPLSADDAALYANYQARMAHEA